MLTALLVSLAAITAVYALLLMQRASIRRGELEIKRLKQLHS